MWLLPRRRRLTGEMTEEMRFHIEMEAAELERQGMPADEAQRRALASFGGLQRFQEEGMEVGSSAAWQDFKRDVAYALRSLRRSPGYTTTVILTLALGIAANTSIFSVANGILFKPLPYRDPSRLMVLWDDLHWVGAPEALIAGPEVAQLRQELKLFEGVSALRDGSVAIGGGSVEPQQVQQASVSANFFELLGTGPVIGRSFARDDEQPGAPKTAVISRRLFVEHFGGEASVVGRHVLIDGAPTTIIGVLPASFHFSAADVHTPVIDTLARMPRGPHTWSVLARVRSDVSVPSALAELQAVSARVDAEQYWHKGFASCPCS